MSTLTYQNQLTLAYEILDEEQNRPLYYDEVMDAADSHELYEEHQLDRLVYEPSHQLTNMSQGPRLAPDPSRTHNQAQTQAPKKT